MGSFGSALEENGILRGVSVNKVEGPDFLNSIFRSLLDDKAKLSIFALSLSRLFVSFLAMPRLRWQEVIKATTNNPWTTNFRHLMQVDRSWLKRKAAEADQRKAKVVHSANRIKYWNIVPGDQIRIRGDRSDTLHSVHAINKLSNQVFLKPTEGDVSPGSPVDFLHILTIAALSKKEEPEAKITITQDVSSLSATMNSPQSQVQ